MAFTKVLPTGISSAGSFILQNVNSSGVSTFGNTVVGGATTELVVNGNARVTGILTIGTSSVTLDGTNNQVNVGTGVTIHHTNGVQVGINTLHSSGLTINQINVGTGASISSPATNVLTLGTNSTEAIRIGSNGNVGVGTTNPLQPMDIVANDGAYAQYFRMRYSYNDYSFIGFRSSNGSEDIAQIGAYRSSASNGGLVFYTNNGSATGSERVRVSAAGTMTLRASGGAFIEGYNADDNQMDVVKLSRMGYATNYKNLIIGKHLPNTTSYTYQSISLNYDPSTNASGNFNGSGNEIFVPNNNQTTAQYTSILQPNTTNNGFNALVRFGPSGQVLTPNQPRFFAKCNTSSYSTTSPIQFTSVDVNIGSGYDSSTYRFTAPIAGTYYFVSTTYVNAGNTANDGGYPRFRVNGTSTQYAYAGPGSSASPNGHLTLTLTKIVSLSVNDYVDVTFNVYGTGSYFAGPSETTFGGYLMG